MDIQENWGQEEVRREYSVEELDKAALDYKLAREDYEKKKKISNEADAVAKEKMRKLYDMLKDSGKSKWELDDASFSTKTSMQYAVPKTLEERKQVIQHFLDQGEDGFNFVTVNSRTLNSYINAELESNPHFVLEGVGMPTTKDSIIMRRKK